MTFNLFKIIIRFKVILGPNTQYCIACRKPLHIMSLHHKMYNKPSMSAVHVSCSKLVCHFLHTIACNKLILYIISAVAHTAPVP